MGVKEAPATYRVALEPTRADNDVPPGYQRTEVGVIPEDWSVDCIENFARITTGSKNTQDGVENGQFPFFVRSQTVERINSYSFNGEAVLTAGDGVGTGKVFHYIVGKFDVHQRVYQISEFARRVSGFFFYLYFSEYFYARIMQMTAKSSVDSVRRDMIARMLVPVPPIAEQLAIAEALSDADALIESLQQLVAKQRALKQGAMQALLTGRQRLPRFSGEWRSVTLEECSACLDNVRVPLNEAQRSRMKGSIPYCGANGVLDYVDRFVLDDDVILMAEDGGYFDEYATRPIAYRMTGKIWVNNHAHVLKATFGFDQGFVFFALVHKNILPFLANGTRAKLNRSELNKIEVDCPADQPEQSAIAAVLSDMDAGIGALEARLAKTRALKAGMMQQLLTGRIRLPLKSTV